MTAARLSPGLRMWCDELRGRARCEPRPVKPFPEVAADDAIKLLAYPALLEEIEALRGMVAVLRASESQPREELHEAALEAVRLRSMGGP